MNALEWRAVLGLGLVYALRMVGMFMVLPVFALYAQRESDRAVEQLIEREQSRLRMAEMRLGEVLAEATVDLRVIAATPAVRGFVGGDRSTLELEILLDLAPDGSFTRRTSQHLNLASGDSQREIVLASFGADGVQVGEVVDSFSKEGLATTSEKTVGTYAAGKLVRRETDIEQRDEAAARYDCHFLPLLTYAVQLGGLLAGGEVPDGGA